MPRAALWLAVLTLTACPAKDEDTGPADTGPTPRDFSDCDPLSYDYCAMPFPSTYFMREDDTSPTGWRIHLGPTTLPVTHQGLQPDPWMWNERDGWSPLGPLLAFFPDMSLDGIVGHDDIGASLEDGASIVILDAETGARQPYFAELDVSGLFVVPGENFLMIRPVKPLAEGHRYIVGIRNVKDESGALVPASEGYAALRDGTPTDNWDIEGRRERYEGIYAALEADGWTRAETQLAWDFVVGSEEGITGKATFMIEDALATVGQAGPAYTITQVDDEYSESIYRRILGEVTVPLYMEEDEAGSILTRGADGMPYQNGTTTVPFTVLIPRTAVEDPRPLPLVQYGHGLLGAQDEVQAGYLGEMADRYGFVLFAMDWTGMKEEDADAITLMIPTDIGRFGMIPERSQQGFVEFACGLRMVRGSLWDDPELRFGEADGVPVIDPDVVYYYGNSQGGILGGAYLALSPEIERGVLGVPGMPYSLLLARSADFTPFFSLFEAVYPDQRDVTLWMVLMDTLWNSGEAAGYGVHMVDDPFYAGPKQVLVQDALGDAQVTNLGAHIMARAYHASQPAEAVREVWGVDTVAPGFTGNGLGEYSFGAPEEPYENLPPDEDFDTHEDTRRAPTAQEQLWTFLTTGVVTNVCDGACDPD